ncbi:MAG: carbohydrate kinase family protein [Anaerolineae bacterium]
MSTQTNGPVWLDVLATGYPSLDYIFRVSRSPGLDETAIVYQLPEGYTFGGCGANVAVGLARLGLCAGVAMVVGDDPAGRAYTRYLAERGVDTADVQVWPDAATSQSRLFINPDGDYQNFFHPGASDAWQGELVLKNLSRSRTALLTVGAPHYNRAFVDRVLEAGVPLIWQLKSDVYSYPPEQLDRLARKSTLLIMNRVEANYLAEELEVAHARRLLRDDVQLIVITCGTAGSLVIDADGEHEVPVVEPRQACPGPGVVDPTGAGDGYTTGFLAGWLRGFPSHVCGRMGATLASFVVEKVGCQTNLPDWTSLASRYLEHFGEPLPTLLD